MPHVFYVKTSQRTIKVVVLVAWLLRAQVQAKMHVKMAVPKTPLLADKDLIATQWLQSQLNRLDNGTNHKQIF